MKFRTLIRRNLRFHWRSHLGVVLGAAIGSAALIGALVVGDSVRESLRERALQRLGHVWAAMNTGDRFLSEDSATMISQKELVRSVGPWQQCSVGIQLPCSIARTDGGGRVNAATALAMDISKELGLPSGDPLSVEAGTAALNAALAKHLNVQAGDEIILRVPKPSAFSREAAIATRGDDQVALRLRVARILPSPTGDFSLLSGPRPVWNVFLNRDELAKQIGLNGGANLVLLGPAVGWEEVGRFRNFIRQWANWSKDHARSPFRDFTWYRFPLGSHWPLSSEQTAAEANQALVHYWRLADAQCELRVVATNADIVELRTSRVFLDPLVVRAALNADTNAQPILTYIVNLLQAGTNTTPYSMVTAAGAPWTPADMRDDEIIVSQWLADDLGVKSGDEIAMSFFLPESGARLEEGTNRFRVRAIVPMEMPWADRTLMPDFPGIEKAESTSDWDGGFPLVHKIRQKDEDYWKKYKGTPKAFVTLAAGKKMWGNRFGELTAIRFPIPTNFAENYSGMLEQKILANLKPEELGLRFEPVREQALKAVEESQPFGQLFLGFSFFLILAALLLMAMLFQFGLEQRAAEIGTLLALGFTPKQVRKLLLREGVALSLLGGIIGTLGGIGYAKAMLHGLATIWRDAVGGSSLNFHITTQTLVIGLFASVVVSAITIWLTLRKFVRRPARELLVGEIGTDESKVQSLKSKVIGAAALLTGVALAGWAVAKGDTANAGIFFGAGSLVLIAGLCFVSAWVSSFGGAPASGMARTAGVQASACSPDKLKLELQHAGSETGAPMALSSLALRGCARRRKRSLATVAMLACGSFLIVSIGVFRLDANRDATEKSSGTGGFALIGETTMPVVHDLNSQSGRDFFALNERDLEGVSFVPFRVRAGDEASCLNLNAAQRPRLLGVKTETLTGRFSFVKLFDQTQEAKPWASLPRGEFYPMRDQPLAENEVAAIGDANSIQWAMHKKVGDTIDYVDERGQPFKVRIVGAVANSILQGQLIIDEAEFVKRFPGESGYRMFLIDASSNSVSQLSATLSRAMQDVGLELTPTAQRLAQFNAVQNTYLGTFQILGGLGLLLGSAGLGIVVLRNVLERRGELAVLMAVGFRKSILQKLVLMENGALLALGLALGIVAAAVAVLPALLSPSAQLPLASLAVTLAAVLLNGAAWTWVATRFALRGNLLAALRNE